MKKPLDSLIEAFTVEGEATKQSAPRKNTNPTLVPQNGDFSEILNSINKSKEDKQQHKQLVSKNELKIIEEIKNMDLITSFDPDVKNLAE